MIYRLTAIALAITGVSAFAPARRGPSAQKTALDASVVDTLMQFEGLHFCWGSEGPTPTRPRMKARSRATIGMVDLRKPAGKPESSYLAR